MQINLNAYYFEIKKHLLPPELIGCVASLPLYFEVNRTSFENFCYKYEKYLHLIKIVHTPIMVISPITEIASQEALEYYPVAFESIFTHIPQIIPQSDWTTPSGASIVEFRLRFERTVNYYDNASFEYTNRPEKYSIPEITTTTLLTHMKTQIYTRYYRPGSLDVRTDAKSVVDSFLPFMAITGKLPFSTNVIQDVSESIRAISPVTAELLGCLQLPITALLSELSYNIPNIEHLLNVVKRKQFTINFAGVGGTGINTIYWLHALTQLCSVENLFKEIHIFEKDCIDFSNIFRFPLPLSCYTSVNDTEMKKLDLIYPYARTLSSVVHKHDKFLETIKDIPSIQLVNNKLKSKIVTYGAPSIANRNFLSSLGNFVSATHANNTASLWLNPTSDDNLQIETYGLIQLNSFFMNQLSMAIEFLKILATPGTLELQDSLWADMTFLDGRKFNYQIDTELLAIPIEEE